MTFSLEAFLTAAKDRADEAVRLRRRRAEYDAYMQSLVWAGIRRRRLERSHYRCEKCGATKRLEVHHLTYERFGGGETMADLQVLCERCHDKIHNRAHGRKF